MSDGKITLTVRLIKSFEYRTFKNVILHDVDPTTMTCGQLKENVLQSNIIIVYIFNYSNIKILYNSRLILTFFY